MMSVRVWFHTLLASYICLCVCLVESKKSKYSASINTPNDADVILDPKNLGSLDNPFRMQKVNMLWEKAKKRLPENKLKILYADLKSQDKDELMLKKMKSDGQDKTGVKESAIRKQLTAIIKKYGLSDPWEEPESNDTAKGTHSDPSSDYLRKLVFKDKKLNKLWLKAEQAGLNELEIETLKEEFQHHQDKIDQYYMLMDRVNDQPTEKERTNSIEAFLDSEEPKQKPSLLSNHQMLKEKHVDLRDNFDKLVAKISGDTHEFEVFSVQKLWEMAQKADFTPSELNSLRNELHHYENRIKKLRYFQSELDASENTHGKNKHFSDKPTEEKHLYKKVKDFEYKVSKIHNELESRIMQRHSEL